MLNEFVLPIIIPRKGRGIVFKGYLIYDNILFQKRQQPQQKTRKKSKQWDVSTWSCYSTHNTSHLAIINNILYISYISPVRKVVAADTCTILCLTRGACPHPATCPDCETVACCLSSQWTPTLFSTEIELVSKTIKIVKS